MKKLLSLAVVLLICTAIWAQGFNYQAVARDANGTILSNQNLSVEIAIFESEFSNAPIYSELHDVTTTAYGLFTLVVGKGIIQSAIFDNINWTTTGHFLGVKINTGNNFVDLGRTALQGVPYSKFADVAEKVMDAKLSELSDVQTNTLADGQVLKWNAATQSWQPANDNVATGSGTSVNTSSRFTGDGSQGNPLDLARQGAQNGQVMTWQNNNWQPATPPGTTYQAGTGIQISNNTITNTGDTNPNDDVTTSTTAGGDLSGTFSNLQIRTGVVGTNEIANGSIQAVDLANGVIPTTLSPSGAAGGDLSGNYPNPLVTKLQGRTLSNAAPTTGQLLTWNGSAWTPTNSPLGEIAWRTNNDHIFYNTGNVGIGLSTPQNKLHIHNSEPLFGSPSALQFTNNSSGTAASDGLLLTLNSTIADYGLIGGLMMRENASLGFGTNNNYHLFLKQNGLLGLGTFNPQGKMDIRHNSTTTSPQLMLSEEATDFARLSFQSLGVNNKYWTVAGRTQANDSDSRLNFFYNNGTTGQDILSINGNGNVGIGTVAPARPLHIHANNTSTNTGNIYLTQSGTGDVLMHLGLAGGAHYNIGIDNSDNDELKIGYNATQPGAVNQGNLLSLDKDGNLGIQGKMTRPEVAGSSNLLPIAYGTINANGTIAHGSNNFGIQKPSQGVYEIQVVGITLNKSTTTAIVSGQQISYISYTINAEGKLLVRTATIFGTVNPVGPTGTAADYDFSFIIYMR